MSQKQVILLILSLLLQFQAVAQLDAYRKKLKAFRYTKHLDSSEYYFKKALPIALKSNDSIAIFFLYKNMGDAFEHHQKLDKTLNLYAICDRFIPYNNLKLKSFLLNDLAYTYGLLHNYDKATKLTLKALTIAEKSGDVREICTVSISVAEGFSNLNLNKQALEYYQKAIVLSKKLNSIRMMEYAYRNFATHLIKNKQTNLAFENLILADKFAKQSNDSISMAYTWQQLSACYWQKNNPKLCFEYGKKAEKIWQQRAENRDVSSICAQLGNYYLELKDYKNAGIYLKKAESLLLQDLYFNEKVFSALSSYYQKTNQPNLAFNYLFEAKKTIEKIKENESKSKVASLRIEFETDKKEIEIQKQKQKNESSRLREQQIESKFLIVAIFLGFSLLAIASSIFYLKKINIKNNLLKTSNESLEKLAQQKQILLKETHHRVKNNLTTLKSLFYLQGKSTTNTEVQNVLKECELRIDSMALIHQSLYENGESDDVDFKLFIENLFESLENTFQKTDTKITVSIEIANVVVDLSKAIFLGLIINELATNSFKHAFKNQKYGEINLKILRNGEQTQITFSDNGSGIVDFENQKNGFGLKLINILTKQIDASLNYSYINQTSQFLILMNEN
jgi:two-component system, sensor histidine kinase PdtaS